MTIDKTNISKTLEGKIIVAMRGAGSVQTLVVDDLDDFFYKIYASYLADKNQTMFLDPHAVVSYYRYDYKSDSFILYRHEKLNERLSTIIDLIQKASAGIDLATENPYAEV